MRSNDWPIALSIGVISFLSPPASADEELVEADRAMYQVKTSGKNQISGVVIRKQTPLCLVTPGAVNA
jgi:GGDEF domain-containing protein